MSLIRRYPSNVTNSSNTSKYIELQLENDRLFRRLSYGHIHYDVGDLNEMRENVHLNQMIKHNIKINHLMSQERSRYKLTPPIQRGRNLVLDQELIRNTNLLSANKNINSDKIEYVTKYQLVDCKLIKNQPATPSLKKHISMRERLKLLLDKRPVKPQVTLVFNTAQEETSTELNYAHREFMKHELERIRTSIP